MNNQGNEKMSIPKSMGYALHTIWNADKKSVLITFYKECTEKVFNSFFSIYLIRYIYECIEQNIEFYKLVKVVALFCAVHVVVHINSAYMDYRNRVKQPAVYQYVFDKVIKKAEKIELTQYEKPDFYNKFSRALDECLDQLMNGMLFMAKAVGGFLAVAAALYQMGCVDVFLPIIAMTASVGTVLVSLRKNQLEVELRTAETKERRVLDYTKRVMYEKKYAGELRLYGIRNILFKKYQENNDRRYQIEKSYYNKIAFYSVLEAAVCIDLAILGTYLYIDYILKIKGAGSVGGYIAMTSAIVTVSYMLREALRNFDETGRAFGYMKNLKEFLEYEVPVDTDKKQAVNETLGDIKFEHVSFTYEGSTKPVIKDLSLHIKKGEKIALVGENGAGKTTLMKVLMGLYPITKGKVIVNGVDIEQYDAEAYHDRFGAVFQDFQIFGLPLSENVLMREPENQEERELVQESLERAQFGDVLEKLPDGIDTVLTKEFDQNGFVCSGGQGQKVAIARVFAKNPDIVILDEPSSALDPIAEFNMYQNMLEASYGKTVFFISHRMSSARIADRILYMEQGTVVEQGTHDELMKINGRYAHMFTLQAKNYQEKGEKDNYEG